MASITTDEYENQIILDNYNHDESFFDRIGFTEDGTWNTSKSAIDLVDRFLTLNIIRREYVANKIRCYFDWTNPGTSKSITEVGMYLSWGNMVPAMTSNILPSGVASASIDNTNAYKCFDRNIISSNWGGAHGSTDQYVSYESEEAIAIGKYGIVIDTAFADSPKDFELRASVDGSFTDNEGGAFIVDSQTSQSFADGVWNEYFCQGVDSIAKYKYYRLYMIDFNGGTNVYISGFRMDRIELAMKSQVTKTVGNGVRWEGYVDFNLTIDRS